MSDSKESSRSEAYGIAPEGTNQIRPMPVLDYSPPRPKRYRPRIGLVGCGGISAHHLRAYRNAAYEVVALCDVHLEAAESRRAEYYPNADVYTDASKLLARSDIDVVDIATHCAVRVPLVEMALLEGKHVLSQKPFVLDLADGERLGKLAQRQGLKLAINQNGRWSPYVAYMRAAIREGLIGDTVSTSITMNWDHTWTAGTAFEKIPHLIFFDFAIHWFDMTSCYFGNQNALWISAQTARAPNQTLAPPLLAQAQVQFERGLVSLQFNGHSHFAPEERTVIVGTKGILRSEGPVCGNQRIFLADGQGTAEIELKGEWFPDGFGGAMGELLCAIEENREPETNAFANLRSLALCFGAMQSADSGNRVKLDGGITPPQMFNT